MPWRPGGDLLSHVLRRSTIGAEAFHGRVRDGIGCWEPRHDHQVTKAHANRPERTGGCRQVRTLMQLLLRCWLVRPGLAAARGPPLGKIKPIERLVRLSFRRCRRSTCLLST